jgi:hypothetical protein
MFCMFVAYELTLNSHASSFRQTTDASPQITDKKQATTYMQYVDTCYRHDKSKAHNQSNVDAEATEAVKQPTCCSLFLAYSCW